MLEIRATKFKKKELGLCWVRAASGAKVGENASKPSFYPLWTRFGTLTKLTNTLFLQNRGLYEFNFLRDGPYFFKVNAL